MNVRSLSRFRWHMLWHRHYWWKIFRKLREALTRKVHLESLVEDAVEVVWCPAAQDTPALYKFNRQENGPLRILYVAPKYDYGNAARGLSYEENNFFHVLYSLGHVVIRFDYLAIKDKCGRKRMNEMLMETAYRYKPDLTFFVLFADELQKDTIGSITKEVCTTVNWFTDDHWRFNKFSRHWAPYFSWAITTTRSALVKYHSEGIENVLLSQWACNHRLCYPMNLEKIYDVSFVGQPHSNRREVINQLRRSGIEVNTWGYGWKSGKIRQSEMVRIFNQSKINLNLSSSSAPGQDQIKGRNFEILGCGGFLLTEYVEELEDYYRPGEELEFFYGVDDLRDKIEFYLKKEDTREAIATRGYQRTIKDHTYDRRFQQLFNQII